MRIFGARIEGSTIRIDVYGGEPIDYWSVTLPFPEPGERQLRLQTLKWWAAAKIPLTLGINPDGSVVLFSRNEIEAELMAALHKRGIHIGGGS